MHSNGRSHRPGAAARSPETPSWMERIQRSIDHQRSCLSGSRCSECGAYYFPQRSDHCRNPDCGGTRLHEVALARTGTLWSYTNACIPPPPPFVGTQPFTPFAIAAVRLEREGLLLLGRVADGVTVEHLRIGMQMELLIERLHPDSHSLELEWKWKPTGAVA
jgi:uncharacterized OB-fold protein